MRKRALVVGVALVGASAITASPATAAVPALATAQARDVQLAAAANPLQTWQNTLNTAFGHVQYGLNEMSTLYPQLAQELAGAVPVVLEEFAGVLTNTAGWQQVLNNLPSYAERIQAAIEASQEQDPNVPDDLPDFNGMLENVAGYLQNQQFNNAFAEFNQYFLWSLGSGAWPLLKELTIGSEILETIGAHRLANVWDAMLVGPDGQGGAVTDFTLFTLGPIVTAAFQFTEGLDDIAAAVKANDWENAIGELLDIAPKTLNAYLNGYNPRVSDQPWDWAGVLTNRGTLEYFAFTLPREITWALINPRFPAVPETMALTVAPESALPEAISTSLTRASKLLSLDLDALSPEAEADKATEDAVEKVIEADETEVVETTPATDGETVPAETTPVDKVEAGEEAVQTTPTTDTETTPAEPAPAETDTAVEDLPASADQADPAAESAKSAVEKSRSSKFRSIRNKLADRFGKGESSRSDSRTSGNTKSGGDSAESKSENGDSGAAKSDGSTSDSKSAGSKSGSDKSESGKSDSGKSDSGKSDSGSDSKSKSKSGSNE
ncbi:hypothetical protein [[Mycobacterium] wendilense]|uniref:PE-PGRS family protein n=1 Tax=[Mycobacterium] wendilense TaxID=3064284 RepID=A0ABM9MEM7_9MYCO|nr:hypothetical protein [Mycolicibacterium sp. MU0050]CAJ1583344.1 hypothetical protein MU0050_002565 [Mycolicibacterium sp. MU0050]